MMVMFSKHDGVGASGAVAARGVIRYMTAHSFAKTIDGQKVVEPRNPPPEILRGDPDLMSAAIAAVPFERRYVSAVLSFAGGDIDVDAWNSGDAALRAQIADLMADFENRMFAGIDEADRPPTYWTTHRHVGRLELNFVTPRAILVGDQLRSININPPGAEQRRLCDAFRDVWNARQGWADPEDPGRRRTVKVPDHVQKIDALRQRLGEATKADIRQDLTATIAEQIAEGNIQNREGVLEFLSFCEAEITRVGDDYISVRFPGQERATRLKGEVYSASFTSPEALSKRDQAASGRVIDLAATEQRLAELTRRRAEFNFVRYQSKIDRPRGFDRANPFADGPEFAVNVGPIRPAERTFGSGGIEFSPEDRARYGKQKTWKSLYSSTLPADLLAEIRRIKPGDPPTVYLSDGSFVVDHGNRLEARPEASGLAMRLLIEEARAKGWTSVTVTGDAKFKLAAAMALTEAGLGVKNPELAHIVNSVRRAKSEAERAAESASQSPKEIKVMDDTDLAPRPRAPLAANFIKAAELGPRPLPAKPINFDSSDVRQLYIRQHCGQAWPEEQIEKVRFVRRMREEGGIDITLSAGQIIADRSDQNITLAKGEIDAAAADTIVFMAGQNGWKALEINEAADDDFKRLIIEAAARQGLEVSGMTVEQRAAYEAERRRAAEADAERQRQAGRALADRAIAAQPLPFSRPAAPVPQQPAREPEQRRDRDFEPGV